MLLPFTEKFNQKDTNFEEKIQEMLIQTGKFTDLEIINFSLKNHGYKMPRYKHIPKIHTIRLDLKNRWKTGIKIHPIYNNRTRNMYQIAPTFPCINTQSIEIHFDNEFTTITIIIDGKWLYNPYSEYEAKERNNQKEWLLQFVKNDGFENIGDFELFFENSMKKSKSLNRKNPSSFSFIGKIIHFTDLLY